MQIAPFSNFTGSTMDQRQKDFIGSIATEYADSIRAIELAELLKLAKLVTSEKIMDIMARTESNFCRNLRLFDAVQESSISSAFDDFMNILERLNPNSPSRLRSVNQDSNNRKPESVRSLLGKFMDTYASGQYPLGMKSGSLSSSVYTSPSYHSTSAASSYQSGNTTTSQTLSSPLKEEHRATLICPSNNFDRSRLTNTQPQTPSRTDSGFILDRRLPAGQLPVTPATTIAGTSNGTRMINGSDRRHVNKFCQTPTRSSELTSINNLSLADEDEDDRLSETSEPLISWHPYATSPINEGDSRAISPHCCNPSYSSASSESGESSADSLIVDPNHILDSNVMTAIAQEGPHMMSVKTATVCHNNLDEDYKMTARPRGNCLIVNNINFENDIFPTRKGSDEDANRFDNIFKQLGFETIMTRNLTADQMRDKFKELAAACKPEHDALFIFLLSHGSEHGIYGTDGLEVYLDSEIISCFDNRNCKAMIGKPKVFVIQACRGRSKDCGGQGDTTDSVGYAPASTEPTAYSSSQENRVPASWLPSNHPPDSKRRKHPIRTDMLIVYSCLAGASIMCELDLVIRSVTEDDAESLLPLFVDAQPDRDVRITLAELKRVLRPINEQELIDARQVLSENNDSTIELDLSRAKSNEPACLGFLATIKGCKQPVGFVVFHIHYSPWSGHRFFMDLIYVRPEFRHKGIANCLLEELRAFSRNQGVQKLIYEMSRLNSDLLERINRNEKKVLRNDDSDWSVFRINFG